MSKRLSHRSEKARGGGGKGAIIFLSFFLLAAILGVLLLVRLNEMEKPEISLDLNNDFLGVSKEMGLAVIDRKSGIKKVSAVLRQGEKETILLQKSFPRHGYIRKAGPGRIEETVVVEASKLGFREGSAELVVTAADFSFWNFLGGNVTVLTKAITIDTRRPAVTIDESSRYIKPGGAGLVVYRLSEPVVRHGALVNNHFHAGFPISSKGENVFGAMIGLPFDTSSLKETFVVAEDYAGNEGKNGFSLVLRKASYKFDKITISDSFLSSKIPEFVQFYQDIPGETDVEKYIYINTEMRKRDNDRIREICGKVSPERLWSGRFGRMPRSSPQAGYADTRSYYYNGQKIDEQVHLGIDLASLQHADVPAANRGRVVFAEYLGIYGNMVILDHGQGLFSIYSHLNQIKAAVGDLVEKDQTLGQTGVSGMAGGDHLHFGIVVNGVFVDPIEWWDEHWLQVNLFNYL